MARTSDTEVRKIVKVRPKPVETDALASGITTANTLVTYVCIPTGYDEVVDAVLLAEIEKYLAAHFFCIFKPRRRSEQAGSVMETIESKVDLGLDVTRYGQQAKLLDVRGGLAVLDEIPPTAKVALGLAWLGTERT